MKHRNSNNNVNPIKKKKKNELRGIESNLIKFRNEYSHSKIKKLFLLPGSIEYRFFFFFFDLFSDGFNQRFERNQSPLPIEYIYIYIFTDKNRGSSNYTESAFEEEEEGGVKPRNAIHHCLLLSPPPRPVGKRWRGGEGREINWKRGVKRRAKLVTRQSTFE